jgi:type I restriction-modification system DNA methylase subunit
LSSFREYANFIWGVADLIRDSFKRGKYQDVILPLTVLRRIDCVLEPTKEKVLQVNARLKGKLDKTVGRGAGTVGTGAVGGGNPGPSKGQRGNRGIEAGTA